MDCIERLRPGWQEKQFVYLPKLLVSALEEHNAATVARRPLDVGRISENDPRIAQSAFWVDPEDLGLLRPGGSDLHCWWTTGESLFSITCLVCVDVI